MSFGRRHRRDGNHKAIVARFKELRCKVWDTSQCGDDAPDLVVGICGRNIIVEIKELGKALSPGQLVWHEEWTGERPVVIWGIDQADALVKKVRERIISGN